MKISSYQEETALDWWKSRKKTIIVRAFSRRWKKLGRCPIFVGFINFVPNSQKLFPMTWKGLISFLFVSFKRRWAREAITLYIKEKKINFNLNWLFSFFIQKFRVKQEHSFNKKFSSKIFYAWLFSLHFLGVQSSHFPSFLYLWYNLIQVIGIAKKITLATIFRTKLMKHYLPISNLGATQMWNLCLIIHSTNTFM